MTAGKILKQYWGFDDFRPMQAEVIGSVLEGRDVLAIMPTGGGKSVCFQVPALMQSGICLVVTPLIALMKDQVLNLKKRGILSLAIHSGQKFHEVKRLFENAVHGEFKFLYVSPERLESALFLQYLPFLKVSMIAVDEAHCISQWGYDFRPSYLRIAALREHLPDVSVIALTASATKKVQQDICDKLQFRADYKRFSQSYERPNLSYSVFVPPSKENKIVEVFRKVPGSGIAYCRSRKRTKDLSKLLSIHRISSDFYHAGLSTEERSDKQDRWVQNKTRIICCTNAFGMGIDKPDVRTVVHFDLPDALEHYYQEAGRAGRDGIKSYAVLVYHPQEIAELRSQVSLRFPPLPEIRRVYGALCSFIQLPAGKGQNLSFAFDIGQFVENYKLNPILVTSVMKILEQEEMFILSDNMFTPSTVEFFSSKETLENIERDFPAYTPIIKGLLRSYAGIFEQPSFIDEFTLARFINKQKADVARQLSELHNMKIIEYIPRGDLPQIYFLHDRVRAEELIVNEKHIALRKEAYEERLAAMISYAMQNTECRSIVINRYFDGEPVLPCGICDVCLAKKRAALSQPDIRDIVRAIEIRQPVSMADLCAASNLHREQVSEAIYFLTQENVVTVNEAGEIFLTR